MNNSQFRRLLVDSPRQQDGKKTNASTVGSPQAVLGGRKNSSLPMTPRHISRSSVQADFARQLAERNAKLNPQKKARSSAPKGVKLAAGYIDRTKERINEEDSEVVQRIKKLEESMKLGEIDRSTFEKLVQEITGGDIDTTHLVKGLDRKLLDRVRRGENVLSNEEEREEATREVSDVEDAFDALAGENIDTVVRERAQKKGVKAASLPAVVDAKRNRNDILKDLKRQREEAAKAAAMEQEEKYPSLGPRFRKINVATSRIETDSEGREVLIITGPDGKEKRKVKKQKMEVPTTLDTEQDPEDVKQDSEDAIISVDEHSRLQLQADRSEDEDIFEGVGSAYDPLAALEDDDDDSQVDEAEEGAERGQLTAHERPLGRQTSSTGSVEGVAQPTIGPSVKRDYFKSVACGLPSEQSSNLSSADATVQAALAKARKLDDGSSLLRNLSTELHDVNEKESRLKRRAVELAASDRDMEDLDLGFGASRFDDAEDMERDGEKIKLSQWNGLGAENEGADRDGKGGKKRKRGSKKRKGDKNSATDVLQAMERQKQAKPLG